MKSPNSGTRENHDAVYRLIMAAWGSQVTRTLASFSVAEHLEDGPMSADQVAERLLSDPGMTHRLLQAATALGFLTYDPNTKRFSGTNMLDILHGNSPLSLKRYARTNASQLISSRW